jgi:hypothetical protein
MREHMCRPVHAATILVCDRHRARNSPTGLRWLRHHHRVHVFGSPPGDRFHPDAEAFRVFRLSTGQVSAVRLGIPADTVSSEKTALVSRRV